MAAVLALHSHNKISRCSTVGPATMSIPAIDQHPSQLAAAAIADASCRWGRRTQRKGNCHQLNSAEGHGALRAPLGRVAVLHTAVRLHFAAVACMHWHLQAG